MSYFDIDGSLIMAETIEEAEVLADTVITKEEEGGAIW